MSIELLVLQRDRRATLWGACLGCDWKSPHLGRALVWKVSSEKGLCWLPGPRHQRPNRWKRPALGLIDQHVANRFPSKTGSISPCHISRIESAHHFIGLTHVVDFAL